MVLVMLLFKVAVVDVDICGPSLPTVMGVEGEQVIITCSNINKSKVIGTNLLLLRTCSGSSEWIRMVTNSKCIVDGFLFYSTLCP